MMDWTLIAGLGILVMAIAGFYLTSSSRYFTIREHSEYSASVNKAIDVALASIKRELDHIHDQILELQQTRPTTGELEARFDRNGLHLNK